MFAPFSNILKTKTRPPSNYEVHTTVKVARVMGAYITY